MPINKDQTRLVSVTRALYIYVCVCIVAGGHIWWLYIVAGGQPASEEKTIEETEAKINKK